MGFPQASRKRAAFLAGGGGGWDPQLLPSSFPVPCPWGCLGFALSVQRPHLVLEPFDNAAKLDEAFLGGLQKKCFNTLRTPMCGIIYSHGWTGREKAHLLGPQGRTGVPSLGAPSSQPQDGSASRDHSPPCWPAVGSPVLLCVCVYPCSVAKLCRTFYHPKDCSPPGSSVHRILQARILEWVATPLSRRSSQTRD